MRQYITTWLLLSLQLMSIRAEDVRVLLNPIPKDAVNALVVIFPEKQKVKAGQKGFDYQLMNRTNKPIFVVVESMNVMGWDRLEGPFGLRMGGGTTWGQASTHELLRLLHAPSVDKSGQPTSGEEEMRSETTCKVRVEDGAEDLVRYIGAKGNLNLNLKIYVESAKQSQRITLSVPVTIEAEQAGTGQPATRPESKSEGSDKPQPEAGGRSR